jgi:predicted nucleic acid-binding protein
MPPKEKARPLQELPAEQTVFIDANIFIYHFTGLSQECSGFLERCERGELWGITAVHILLEVLHRLMMIEAVAKGLVTPGNVAKKLREKPDVVNQLADYQAQTETILEMGIEVVELTADVLKISSPYRRRNGLLVNDSLTVALMISEGILNLATTDQDFQRVEELQIFCPQDLP